MAARREKVLGTALALCALAAVAGTHAAVPASAASCPPPPTPLQPFTPWGDEGQYVLTTGGSFESGTPAWTLAGGATVVNDNAPNRLDPPSHSLALFLPSGSSATSACVTAPQIRGIVRFFAKNTGSVGANLRSKSSSRERPTSQEPSLPAGPGRRRTSSRRTLRTTKGQSPTRCASQPWVRVRRSRSTTPTSIPTRAGRPPQAP